LLTISLPSDRAAILEACKDRVVSSTMLGRKASNVEQLLVIFFSNCKSHTREQLLSFFTSWEGSRRQISSQRPSISFQARIILYPYQKNRSDTDVMSLFHSPHTIMFVVGTANPALTVNGNMNHRPMSLGNSVAQNTCERA
jgi:hypothetical protein